MKSAAFRRVLLSLLLALLPLQFSWAAVGEYCGHESGPASHLGHHEHRHCADAGAPSDGKLPDGGAHPDCGVCHAGHAVFAPVVPMQAFPRASAGVAAHRSARLAAHPVFEPEKPKWNHLA